MPFPSVISAPQKVTLRTSGYWQRTFIAFNPGEIVFQAEAAEDITDAPFKTFAWTNTLSGAYTDVWQGLVCYISSTTTFMKDYKYRGRVAAAPSATTFEIDLNATILETGDIITVVRDADLFAKPRQDTLVDGRVTWHNLPPMTTGLPSVIVLYDSDNDGSVAWTPAQTGIAVASGAGGLSYAWAVSGAGTSTISSAAAQNPNFTFEAGYHYLVRLTTTDSNGVSNFILVQVYAISRTFTAPVILPAAAGNVSQDLDNGYSGSITAYGGVAELPYRTHAVIFCVEHFGDNSSTPVLTNVLMHGRLRSESITTEGSEEGGALQTVTYPIEGITAYMQRLKMPNDIVRHVAAPDEWGEMVNPTPYRMAVYALYAYTTLLNLVSFSAGDSLFDAWRRGGAPVSVDGGYALDVLTTLMAFVDAAPNYAPDGEIRNEINASYKVDRSGLVTIMDFLIEDARAFTLDIDTSQITGQVVGYGGMWNTVGNTFVYYTASAPTIPYSDAPEARELTRVLLQHDTTATAELEARIGNDYAFNNPKWILNVTLRGSHRWMVATNYQRCTWTLAATYNLREIALTTATKFQLQRIDITINPDGTFDPTAQFVQETEFLNAQAIASQQPANLEDMNPVFPILSDDPADPDNPLWMYPTDTPSLEEYPPIDPYSGYLSYSPFTPDQAAQAAQQQPQPGCFVTQVNMRNSGTTLGETTVNTDPYLMQISGFGQISAGGWLYHINYTDTAGDFTPDTNYPDVTSVYVFGTGWTQGVGSVVAAVDIHYFLPVSTSDVTAIRFLYNNDTAANVNVVLRLLGVEVYTDIQPAAVGTGELYVATPPFVEFDEVVLQVASLSLAGNLAITGVTFEGDTTNPFTGEPSTTLDGDAFYIIPPEGEEGAAALFSPTAGLLIDGAKPAVIPDYRADHMYANIPYTGTGNPLQLAFALDDYTDVQSRLITVITCQNP